jgi:hypothetical protein
MADEDNPDLDLDPTMWIPVPEIPTQWPEDLPAKIDAVIKEFRQRQVDEVVRAAAVRKRKSR